MRRTPGYQKLQRLRLFDLGLLAKKAVEAGLTVAPYIKTSLSPGSGVVTYYLEESGVIPSLSKLGFDIVGYGCMTCIGNSGPLPDVIVETIEKVRRLLAPSSPDLFHLIIIIIICC